MIRRSFSLAVLFAATPAVAQPATADLAAIDQAVARFTGAAQGQPGGAALPLDRRLRLASCAVPLTLGWYGTRREAVEVACPMAGGWRIYVPLAGSGMGAPSAPAVTRGDQVTITVSGEGFAVSQAGEALESGATGAWIKVRGQGAGAPVLRARVVRPGLVGMELP